MVYSASWFASIKKFINLIKPDIILIAVIIFFPLLYFYKNILSYLNIHLYSRMPTSKPQKMVVFDLDETLGCFVELGIFWDALENYYGHNLFKEKFFEMTDIFPEFFRPNIFKILDFVHRQKRANKCSKLVIYTNNQGPKSWVRMISDYLNFKLGHTVFDLIIPAYKVGGKIIEPNRTTHDKSIDDLFRCTKMPKTTEVCFIDDLYHPLMKTDNVCYINIKPYHFSMPFDTMATRYYDMVVAKSAQNIKANAIVPDKTEFVTNIVKFMKHYNYIIANKGEEEKKTDKQISKELLSYLEEFFKKGNIKNTRKNRMIKLRKTRSARKMF